ncbi:MAG: class I SAM-dependent methyltransferase [Quinella sp. 2Q5]|nr:class I SAM-dependent methyltransferase [Quinella sp. 2Q5]
MERLNRRIETYWDERSADFSRTRRLELGGIDADAWRTIFRKNLPDGKLKVLDVGTGAGFFAAILSELGHDVTGVDMSAKMLTEADKNLRELNLPAAFVRMNAQALDFADETFDAVVTRNLTWTLPDVKSAYREWRRVLKRGGVLLNFDSDYGDKIFSADVCNEIEVTAAMLTECDAIKNALTISTRRRPMWDAGFLEGLDFAVTLDEDISHAVHRDERCVYDSVPLFAICAVK